MYYQFGYR